MALAIAWKIQTPKIGRRLNSLSARLIIAAAVWHYQGGGLAGWLWSLAVLATVYLALSRLLDTSKKFAPRTYRFAE